MYKKYSNTGSFQLCSIYKYDTNAAQQFWGENLSSYKPWSIYKYDSDTAHKSWKNMLNKYEDTTAILSSEKLKGN